MKPSEILKTQKKKNWCMWEYWKLNEYDLYNDRFCFNGFIFNKKLGRPIPEKGDEDMNKVYDWNLNGRYIHDVIAEINDSKNMTFTEKKNLAIQFLEREG